MPRVFQMLRRTISTIVSGGVSVALRYSTILRRLVSTFSPKRLGRLSRTPTNCSLLMPRLSERNS